MISYHNFRPLVEQLLLDPINVLNHFFDPPYSTSVYNLIEISRGTIWNGRSIWWVEEPLNINDLTDIQFKSILKTPYYEKNDEFNIWPADPYSLPITHHLLDVNFQIFANSEHSKLKKIWLKEYPMHDWYFFFHGFLSIDWFRDYLYLDNHNSFNKVFICLNHLIEDKRNYRIHLLAEIYKENLDNFGHISCPNLNQDVIKKELFKNTSLLSVDAKKNIYNNLFSHAQPKILDNIEFQNAGPILSKYSYDALWHVVTETVFYDDKLHLTEKIFKPIVSRRPFILVGAPGNLSYLRGYGFKTFDKWIDESYDNEQDNDIRIKKIVAEIKKLCGLSMYELKSMQDEMYEVLEFNFKHFYTNFKQIIVEELVDNFQVCTKQYNLHRSERFQLPTHKINFNKVKEILLR